MLVGGRVIELGGEGRYLHLERGFVVAQDSRSKTEVARAPIEDLSTIVVSGFGNTFSQELLSQLALHNVNVVLVGRNQLPTGMFTPIVGNQSQAGRIDAQISLSQPLKKQLWKSIVQAKIRQQSRILKALGIPGAGLEALADSVHSGDPENIESQAARKYWSSLMGAEFRRDRDLPGRNAALNYGYTILRASVTRSVIGCGLLPSLGLLHRDPTNPFRLVDDLMEPYRPFVDLEVVLMGASITDNLTKPVRHRLVELLNHDLALDPANQTVASSIWTSVRSYVKVVESRDYRDLHFAVNGPTRDQSDELTKASAQG